MHEEQVTLKRFLQGSWLFLSVILLFWLHACGGMHGSRPQKPAYAPPPPPLPTVTTTKAKPAAPAPDATEYTVQSGDTLGTISKNFYGTSNFWKQIADYNKLKNPNVVVVGQVLKLPPNLALSDANVPEKPSAQSNGISANAIQSQSQQETRSEESQAVIKDERSPESTAATQSGNSAPEQPATVKLKSPEEFLSGVDSGPEKKEIVEPSPTPSEAIYMVKVISDKPGQAVPVNDKPSELGVRIVDYVPAGTILPCYSKLKGYYQVKYKGLFGFLFNLNGEVVEK